MADALRTALARLRAHDGNLVEQLGAALTDPSRRRSALLILQQVDVPVTVSLLEPIVSAALSHRDALLARETLGRLPYRLGAARVPPVVAGLLDGSDDDTYRRLAELLDHLGLYAALRDLCERAARSDDPNVREVGTDFMSAGDTAWR
jgi:hypothetical protein